jgi:nucleoside-diphosphate-sugar epimerase
MVYGNGLLGKAFKKIEDNQIIIYAKGVSNSQCQDDQQFKREYDELLYILQNNPYQKIVYFSSCSILDTSLFDTPYVQHKINIENLIKKIHNNYLIIRLPQVAGHTNNPNTILNYIHNNIKSTKKFVLWKNAKRNIIDVEDVVIVVDGIIKSGAYNTTLNVANRNSYSMSDIVNVFEGLMNTKATFEIDTRISEYDINIANIESILSKTNIKFDNNYLQKTLKKYYGK